ncbi:MAG TPA: hypothetical protein VMS37_10270 [Verrucomicrobiae bacterium]|nr:hypothetical protein [Verrucomicrobiae bacterium]
MPTITDILTGLPGAGGCDFRTSTGELFYVEYGGNFSKTNPLSPAHTVIGTGYTNPEDIELSADGVNAYITERSGDLVKVSLSTPNRSSAAVITSGMVAPQQMALDEAHDTAYVVEYAPSGHLYQINLTSGAKTPVPVTLNNAVGLLLTSDSQYAYVTEQTSPSGRIRKIRLSDGSATVIVTGLTAPFFLIWGDPAEASLLVAERDPANRVTRVDLATNTTSLVAGPFSSRPGAMALMSASRMLVHGETTLSIVDFLPFITSGPLFMGFGFIPFDKVIQTAGPNQGLADTTVPPGYFYQVKDTPFGGTLPIMINYPAATALGATHYRIMVDGVIRLDSWTDEQWTGVTFVPVTTSPGVVNFQPGFYPVRTAPFQFMNPSLGSLMDSTGLSNAVHSLVVQFVRPNPIPFATSPIVLATTAPVLFRVDNNPCKGVLSPPKVGSNVADACGILRYSALTNTVNMVFTASHPNNFADYSFGLIRGLNVPPAPVIAGATSGQVSAATNPGTITGTVAGLLGPCAAGGMAAFAESLYVAARANNGWSRQSQYDASALIAFTLAH